MYDYIISYGHHEVRQMHEFDQSRKCLGSCSSRFVKERNQTTRNKHSPRLAILKQKKTLFWSTKSLLTTYNELF